MSEQHTQLEITTEALQSLINFDVSSLVRKEDLGSTFSFDNIVQPAKRVIGLFKLIPQSNLSDLPDNELKIIQTSVDSFTNLLNSVQTFNPSDPNDNTNKRDQIIQNVRDQYQPLFTKLFPLISFLTARSTDFSQLESDARAAVQAAKREASTVVSEVQAHGEEAKKTLETIRSVAAEQGVSQQAIHFQSEATSHETSAGEWATRTVWVALGVAALAIGSLFIHKLPILEPKNTYEAVQLGISKVLLFGTAGYMLVLCARNFLAHKHNAVVNKHRQNALVTFKALVDAATISEKQDIVLVHAADCIFSGRDSGFTREGSGSPTASTSVMQLLQRGPGMSTPAES